MPLKKYMKIFIIHTNKTKTDRGTEDKGKCYFISNKDF